VPSRSTVSRVLVLGDITRIHPQHVQFVQRPARAPPRTISAQLAHPSDELMATIDQTRGA
jgi:hypothetical protein